MNNLNLFLSITLVLLALNCTKPNPNNAAFITKLGSDTLAVETFERTLEGEGITAKVLLRIPETTLTKYELLTNEGGGIYEMTATQYNPEDGFSSEGNVVQRIQRDGDSLIVTLNRTEGARTFKLAYQEGVLPFIDMVHWPYEIALENAVDAGQDSVVQPMVTGSRVSDFMIARVDDDSMTIRHPWRGVMGVEVNEFGDLINLNAGLTTRKLKVNRQESAPIDDIAAVFAQRGPLGELSGAETGEFMISGTEFKVEYGSPKMRDRKLFGGIVSFGERWRTGANRATHFYTSEDVVIEGLEVPAGEYTLFTIPEANGGILMINKQTGQNGQSYDESRDLGRVPMSVKEFDGMMEDFTIRVEETEQGSELQLIWGNTIYFVNIKTN